MSLSPPPSPSAPRKSGGWVKKTSVWLPTWRGWLALLLAAVFAILGAIRGVHPFLAVNRPVQADVLVVEGWVPEYALKQGLDLTRERNYRYLLLTGGLVKGEVAPEPGDTYARMAMKRLKRIGGDLAHVRPVASEKLTRDRTYGSALAIRDWLAEEGGDFQSINVMTMGPHARRSRLLFRKALGPGIEVGVIPVTNREYVPQAWWRYSEGVKETLSEGVAYLYARFLFRPGDDQASGA